jgi:hypothetical protein
MSELTEKIQLLANGEVGMDEDAVLGHRDRLEYAEQYGDGALDIHM